MAGCRPEYFPVVVAAVAAMLRAEFDLLSVQARPDPAAPMLVVNGPIRHQIGIASGVGCMGPGWHANATIGRAIRLVLINIGGGTPGVGDFASQGSPIKFSFCFGENEEESPWPPFHTTRGYRSSDSVVTVIGAEGNQSVVLNVTGEGARGPTLDACINTLAARIVAPGSPAHAYARLPATRGTHITIVLNPQTAHSIAALGWSRESLQEAIWDRAKIPIRDRKKYAVVFAADPEEWEVDPQWDDPEPHLRAYDSPADIRILVAGTTQGGNQIIPTSAWRMGWPCSEMIGAVFS